MSKNRRSEKKRDEGKAEGGHVIITWGEGGQRFGSLPLFIKQSLFLAEKDGPARVQCMNQTCQCKHTLDFKGLN